MKKAITSTPQAEQSNLDLVSGGLASIPESEKFLSICRAKLYLLMDAGDLAYVKMGKSRRIPWRVLHAYAASCLHNA